MPMQSPRGQSRGFQLFAFPMVLVGFFLSHVVLPVHGWGTIGHEVVANVAWQTLKAETKEWIVDVLNVTDPTDGNSPLGAVADWADRVRHFLPWSASLHYIDVRDDLIPGGCHANHTNPNCTFQYSRDCVNDVCVAGAIVNYTHQLLDNSSYPTEDSGDKTTNLRQRRGPESSLSKIPSKREAMMFVTHFIGDIHQPLHCSRTTDKGGNDYHVHFNLLQSNIAGRNYHTTTTAEEGDLESSHHKGWNLHSVWDTGLIEVALQRDYNNSRQELESSLLAEMAANPKLVDFYRDCPGAGLNRSCTIEWGQESWRMALHWSYTLDIAGEEEVQNGSNLNEEYYETRWPMARFRLLAGGIRLAATLDAIVPLLSEPKSLSNMEWATHVGSMLTWNRHILQVD